MYLLVLDAHLPHFVAQKAASEKPEKSPGIAKVELTTREMDRDSRTAKSERSLQIKHADVDKLAQRARIFRHIQTPTAILESLQRSYLGRSAQSEDTIRRLDVPPPAPQNVELTVYLLLASDNGVGSVPPELEGVAKQLKTTFAFKVCTL
jgi:hypothetical protein